MTTHPHASPAANAAPLADGPKDRLPVLMLGAVGVVFGDIGTSPFYALKKSFIGPHPRAVAPLHTLGVLTFIFWPSMLSFTFKEVLCMMRRPNRGEGGSFPHLSPAW